MSKRCASKCGPYSRARAETCGFAHARRGEPHIAATVRTPIVLPEPKRLPVAEQQMTVVGIVALLCAFVLVLVVVAAAT